MKDLIQSKYVIFGFNLLIIFFLYSLIGEKNIVLAFSYLHKMSFLYLLSAIIFCLLNFLTSSIRFYFLFEYFLDLEKIGKFIKMNLFSIFLNFYAPLSILGDGFRISWLKSIFKSKTYSYLIKLVLIDRLIALCSILMFILIFLPCYVEKFFYYFKLDNLINNWLTQLLDGVYFLFLIITGVFFRNKFMNKFKNLNKQFIVGILYFLSFFLVMVSTIYGLGFRINIAYILISAPIIFILQNLPVGFAGFGLRELGFLLMFEDLIGKVNALSISFVFGGVILVSALPAVLFFGHFGIKKTKPVFLS